MTQICRRPAEFECLARGADVHGVRAAEFSTLRIVTTADVAQTKRNERRFTRCPAAPLIACQAGERLFREQGVEDSSEEILKGRDLIDAEPSAFSLSEE